MNLSIFLTLCDFYSSRVKNIIQLINSATLTIFISCNYIIDVDNMVANALIKSIKQGVRVKILLDDFINYNSRVDDKNLYYRKEINNFIFYITQTLGISDNSEFFIIQYKLNNYLFNNVNLILIDMYNESWVLQEYVKFGSQKLLFFWSCIFSEDNIKNLFFLLCNKNMVNKICNLINNILNKNSLILKVNFNKECFYIPGNNIEKLLNSSNEISFNDLQSEKVYKNHDDYISSICQLIFKTEQVIYIYLSDYNINHNILDIMYFLLSNGVKVNIFVNKYCLSLLDSDFNIKKLKEGGAEVFLLNKNIHGSLILCDKKHLFVSSHSLNIVELNYSLELSLSINDKNIITNIFEMIKQDIKMSTHNYIEQININKYTNFIVRKNI
ncbi:Cardiolipin synthase A [bacterium AB1]|nr:Cardiolipin synthase A [bacterium AB1]